jgi:hypothetical protein
MRARLRRLPNLLAILAITLHALVPGAVPAVAASVDPFAVICHSESSAPAQAPADDSAPVKTCDHCTLCAAMVFALAPEAVPAGRFVPPRLLQVLRPVSLAVDADRQDAPGLARAPPQAS